MRKIAIGVLFFLMVFATFSVSGCAGEAPIFVPDATDVSFSEGSNITLESSGKVYSVTHEVRDDTTEETLRRWRIFFENPSTEIYIGDYGKDGRAEVMQIWGEDVQIVAERYGSWYYATLIITIDLEDDIKRFPITSTVLNDMFQKAEWAEDSVDDIEGLSLSLFLGQKEFSDLRFISISFRLSEDSVDRLFEQADHILQQLMEK